MPRLPGLIATLSFAALTASVFADQFQDTCATFGTTLTLAGVPHTTTTNPDGSAINFWTPDFEGAPATTVGLSNPHMAQADAYGNVYIADKAGHAILKITTDGKMHSFAGTHTDGFNGDGPAAATTLQISQPNGLYVLPNGIVYVLDPGNHRIRRVDLNGQMTTVVNDTDPKWKSSGRALWVSQKEDLIYYTHEYQPAPGTSIADGAVVKRWTPAGGIEVVCSKTVGFRNPGNIDVNPADGKLYVTDRAEDDPTGLATGLFRIDGVDQRTRMTGNSSQANQPTDGQPVLTCYLQQTRGIAFLADGSYFLCGHKDGSIWYVDILGLLHRYLAGSGRRDGYSLPDGIHPPLTDQPYFAQPRSVTLAPDGNLIVVSNDSGFVFRVANIVPSFATDLQLTYTPTTMKIDWTGLSGRGYRIEQSTDLTNWTGVTAVGAAFNGAAELTSPSSVDTFLFYRVLPAL